MDKWTFAEIVAVAVIIGIIAISTVKKQSGPTFKPDRANFKKGEVLLPDYAHSDTLIVVNAERLNKEIEICDGSDGDIDSVLHRNCIIY